MIVFAWRDTIVAQTEHSDDGSATESGHERVPLKRIASQQRNQPVSSILSSSLSISIPLPNAFHDVSGQFRWWSNCVFTLVDRSSAARLPDQRFPQTQCLQKRLKPERHMSCYTPAAPAATSTHPLIKSWPGDGNARTWREVGNVSHAVVRTSAALLGEPTGGMPSSVTHPSALTGLVTVVVVVYSRVVHVPSATIVVVTVVVVVEGMVLCPAQHASLAGCSRTY